MKAKGKRILIPLENLHNEVEFFYSRLRLIEEGAKVVVAGSEAGKVYRGEISGYPFPAEVSFDSLNARDFDGIVTPGGYAPDILRQNENLKGVVKDLWAAGKVVAHICHGSWLAISAGICKGYKMTSIPAIKDDVNNAGAQWVNAEVVVDRNIVSSRRMDDLPAFLRAILDLLEKA